MFTLKPSDPNFNTTKAPKNIFMCKKLLTCVPSEYSLPWSCFEAATLAMPDQKLNYNQSNIELTLTHQLPFPNYIPSFFFSIKTKSQLAQWTCSRIKHKCCHEASIAYWRQGPFNGPFSSEECFGWHICFTEKGKEKKKRSKTKTTEN